MTEEIWNRPDVLRVRTAEDDWQPQVIAEFIPAPEKAEPGSPGKKPGELVVLPREANAYVVLVSLGKAEKVSLETARQACGLLGKWLVGSGASELAIELGSLKAALPQYSREELAETALTSLMMGAYRFDRYKKESEPAQAITIGLLDNGSPYNDHRIVERVEAIAGAVRFARDLAHEPANVINPASLAERARAVAEACGLRFKVLDEKELAGIGAGAILAVGQGSRTPPRMIILEYPGQDAPPDDRPVVLVGKAITFDTGGYSIKNTENIVGMKYDKSGGVDVLATMQAVAALKLKTPVVGIISAAENMVSSEAYRPDDIITTLSGKTVEIISTDAEGRLVLADALTYAQREYKPRALIDLATLTGGVVVALGRVRAGLISNDDSLANDLYAAGEATGERLWRLPLDEEYSKLMKGTDADLKNSGGREGHCILGGAFLKAFVDDGVPWAHLDIAGMADTDKDLPYAPKGATGFGVRLLLTYLENLQAAA